MRVAAMQPYLFPYLGYLNLMAAVDVFVIRDRVKYSKGGWINRNRLEFQGGVGWISFPLRSSSDYENIGQKQFAPDFNGQTIRRKIQSALSSQPHVQSAIEIFDASLTEAKSLSPLLETALRSLEVIKSTFDLGVTFAIESELRPDPFSPAENGVIEICQTLGAHEYINPPGGRELYSPSTFRQRGITLQFIEPYLSKYDRGAKSWIPGLSFLDAVASVGITSTSRLAKTDFRVTG